MKFFWDGVPMEENTFPGNVACQGCGAALAMRLAMKALGTNTVVTIPACCWTIISGEFPYNSLNVPLWHTAFETTAIMAAGIKAGLTMKRHKDTLVMGWAGDGGTFDIGIQALSGAAERNEDILYVCYDNEAYMNTGIQRSSATPEGAWTTTTPVRHPEDKPKKNIEEILAAHRVPYVATANIAYPEDFVRKFKKARDIKGTRFIHIFAPCPPGWKMSSELSIKSARAAVESKVFPLYEIEDGEKFTINYWPKGIPVRDYLKMQGRFRHLTDERIEEIQKFVEETWEKLVRKHELTHGTTENIPRGGEIFYK